jgi:hypothetical protein
MEKQHQRVLGYYSQQKKLSPQEIKAEQKLVDQVRTTSNLQR